MPAKTKIIVSDLHLGAGLAQRGNALEDFTRDREFADLLRVIAQESDRDGTEVELIVNGDAFEMLQVPHVRIFDPARVYPPERYRSSSEGDAALKMSVIIAGHRPFFQALRRFIRPGSPQRSVIFISGNHDVELHWPAVQQLLRHAMAAKGRRAPLLGFEPRFLCRDGIYVEHGNQYGELVSRLNDMEHPEDPERPGQLALPVGSRFVTDFFNVVERERYWVDGVKPLTALIWYALAFDFPFAARAVAAFIRAIPGVFMRGALPAAGPHADLLRQLEDPARVDSLAARYRASEVFRDWLNDQVAEAVRSAEGPVALGAQGMTGHMAAAARGDAERRQVRLSLTQAAQRLASEMGARLVTFGHTHEAGVEVLPGGVPYINGGTWTWRADLSGAGKSTWQDVFEHPERFMDDQVPTYVRVDYDEAGEPAGQLLVHQTHDGTTPAWPVVWQRFRLWLEGLIRRLRDQW